MKMIIPFLFLSSLVMAQDNCNHHYLTKIKDHLPSTAISFNKGLAFIDVSEASRGFHKAVNKNFEATLIPPTSSLAWSGPDLPAQFRNTLYEFKHLFTKANFEYELQEQGRSQLEVFAQMVFTIGAEQGTRHILHSSSTQEKFAKISAQYAKQLSSPTKEGLDELADGIREFSKSLKPVADASSGMEGMLGRWRDDVDLSQYKIDVSPEHMSAGTKWDEAGRPFKTEVLVTNLKKEFEKIYSLKPVEGQEAFTWYVTGKNKATFTSNGNALLEGFEGSEVDYVIYKQLETGMQQGLRSFSAQSGPLEAIDMYIHGMDSMAQLNNLTPGGGSLSGYQDKIGSTFKQIEKMMKRSQNE